MMPLSPAPGLAGPPELRAAALAAWSEPEPRRKAARARALVAADGGPLPVDANRRFADATRPGRPARPALVAPRDVPQRGLGSAAGRAALLHAIAHIEFNAIDLALDAVWRFAALPEAWYRDWARVAAEEAVHFGLLDAALRARGFGYGDFAAHDGLWAMALRTRHDPLVRVALVPRIMEARGLDVTPGLQQRLEAAGDRAAVAILQRILDDEIGHVAIGNHWYRVLCSVRGLDPARVWVDLIGTHGAGAPRPPFNREARLRAGFTEEELASWQ